MLTIELPPDVQERLLGEASRRGLGAEELAVKLIADHLTPPAEGSSLEQLFAGWAREDQTTDPQELARRHQELEELKEGLNRNRAEMDGPDARKPFA